MANDIAGSDPAMCVPISLSVWELCKMALSKQHRTPPAGMAELADAPVLGTGGQPCRFNSCYLHHIKENKIYEVVPQDDNTMDNYDFQLR